MLLHARHVNALAASEIAHRDHARPNCCKRLTKRRLFARAAVAALEQSALAGGTPPADPPQDGRGGVPQSASLCLAALQSMRTSLGGRRCIQGAMARQQSRTLPEDFASVATGASAAYRGAASIGLETSAPVCQAHGRN